MLRSFWMSSFALFLFFGATNALIAQQASLAENSRKAFSDRTDITRVHMQGTYVSTQGSLRNEGAARITVSSDGTYSVAYSNNSGSVAEEQRTGSPRKYDCVWKDAQGKEHAVGSNDCLLPAWPLPMVSLLSTGSSVKTEWKLVREVASEHKPQFTFDIPARISGSASHNSVSSTNIPFVLDISKDSYLVEKASYVVHVDRQPALAIPIEVRFGDYSIESGVNMPHHIQKLINGTLVLDISINAVQVE